MAMYTILIVDDNPHNLFTLRTLLQANIDADVLEADSGVAALERVTHHKIDLIVLDVQMPNMDGFETAKLIRNRKRYQDIPIIFLTAVYKSDEFKEKGLAGGAIDYLTKPIDESMLINRVKAYLRLLETERAANVKLQALNAQLQAEIEERKRIEHRLAGERNLLQTLIDHLPDVVYVKDPHSRFILGNTALLNSVGLTTVAELVGKTDFDFHPSEAAAQYHADEQALLQSGQPMLNHEERIVDARQNTSSWLLTSKIPFYDGQGQLAGLVGIGRDITQIKQAEETLIRLNQELQQASQYKSDFLSSMSHELRTPLNATIGYIGLAVNALKNTVPPDQVDNLIKAERSARTLLQLINDVLDFSKIEAGKMDALIEMVDLTEILEDVAITAEGLLAGKPVEIKLDIAPQLPTVESDYTKIKQMLNNLVGNAIKFTTHGAVSLRAKPMQDSAVVRLEVEDTGGGIPSEKLSTIFDAFTQADSSIKKKFGGTGLGLAITKQFCNLLGIEIGVRSEVGVGTMFWLHIPLASPQAQTAAQTPGAAEKTIDAAPVTPVTPVSQVGTGVLYHSVLVVDDEEMNLMLLKSVFESRGCTVAIARSGKEAVKQAQAIIPDLILLDIAMPGMDGVEVAQALRRDPATAGINIIACSAMATEDVRGEALAAGCDGFIQKPVEMDVLLHKVADILARKRNKT